MNKERKKITGRTRRVVVKLGSSLLAGVEHGESGNNSVREDILVSLSRQVQSAKRAGTECVIVSSGAVSMGMESLNLTRRPTSIPMHQAIAAVGQGALMGRFDNAFGDVNELVAQVLLTHDDLADRKRFLNARNTIMTLLEMGIVPVINENDTVAVEEIKFGDNDTLSALTTNLIEADLLVILTNIDGLYDRDPTRDESARRIDFVEDVDSLVIDGTLKWYGAETSSLGTGGMVSKLDAARKAAHFGAATVVASGFTDDVLDRVLAGDDIGTFFLPREDKLTSKKHWIAFSTRPTGRVFIDSGAREALMSGGKSLLPSGITSVDGSFDSGEVIHCVDSGGMEFARGITNYSSIEIENIRGRKSEEIAERLGYKVYDEVIHRDNLVVI